MRSAFISGIYSIACAENGKAYIGSSHNTSKRWSEHRTALENGDHHNQHLQNAWNKYGPSAFSFQLLEACEVGELISKEQSWINATDQLFNILPNAGTTLGRRHKQSTKDKLSKAAKERIAKRGNPMKGKKRPDVAERNRNTKPTPGQIESLRARSTAMFKGKPLSPEHKKKISDALRGRPKSDSHRIALAKAAMARLPSPLR